MKILIVTDAWHPQLNGVVRTYEYLSQELEAMGHVVKVIGPGDFPKSYPMPGYGEIRLVLLPYAHLRNMIEEFKPDLLHIGTEGPLGISARRYAKKNNVKFTSCYHTHFPDYAAARAAKYGAFLETPVRKAGIAFVRWFHSISSCLFTATPSLEDNLRAWEFEGPIKRMTRGVDFAVFHEGEKNLFHDMPKPVALYVGRVAVEKNLDAFLSMAWQGSKIVVGDGPDLAVMKFKYPNVVFAGVKTGKELADYYRSSDVFVFPSKTDTFGMVLIEAMACGLPIAAYLVTGPIDIVTDDVLGTVGEDLSAAAHRALQHGMPAQRAAQAKNNYSWRLAAQQFLEINI